MNGEFDVFKSPKYELSGITVHARKRYSMRAELAINLVSHFALIAAKDDGDDTSGRRASKLQSTDEVVNRACDIAEKMIDELEKRNWIIDIPAYEEIPVRAKEEQ